MNKNNQKIPSMMPVLDEAGMTEQQLRGVELLPVTSTEDRIQIAELAKVIWHEHYDSIIGEDQVDYMTKEFQSPEAIKHQMEQEGYQYYKLDNQGESAGYFAYRTDFDRMFLSKLYIARKYRGRAYSHRVLDFLEQYCREQGLKSIWLTVNKNNCSSIAVYEKLGFHKAGTQVADIGSGYVMDDFIMEKPLTGEDAAY